MQDSILDGQRDLVDLVEGAGWDVTDTELSVYRSPWSDDDDPEATVVITARKGFEPADGGSPYRRK